MEDDTIFWDRLAEMPWLEALDECVSRREGVVARLHQSEHLRIRVSKQETLRITACMSADAAQLTVINERIKWLRLRLDRASWKNAVKALYGQEGYEACLVWMAQVEREL